jgi:ankyrin repeat protein
MYWAECTGGNFDNGGITWDLQGGPFAGVACHKENQTLSLFVGESQGYDCNKKWFIDFTCAKTENWNCVQECLAQTVPLSECNLTCGPLKANPASQSLIDAVAKGNLVLAQQAITDGADVNILDIAKRTPLMNSVVARNFPMSELLLTAGANVNQISQATQTNAMFYAISNLDSEMVTLLLKAGAEKAAMLEQVRLSVVLNRLAANGDNHGIAYFVSLGADVNWGNQSNYTPLMHAAMQGKEQTVRFLLVLGADKDVKTTDTLAMTAKELAIQAGFKQLAEKLL